MSDSDNLLKTEDVRLSDGYPYIVEIDYGAFNALRYAARVRSTIHPSELAAIIGLNSYRGTRLRRIPRTGNAGIESPTDSPSRPVLD